jgi:hypothetical protein
MRHFLFVLFFACAAPAEIIVGRPVMTIVDGAVVFPAEP